MHDDLVIICNGFSLLVNVGTQELKAASSLMAKIAFSYNIIHIKVLQCFFRITKNLSYP